MGFNTEQIDIHIYINNWYILISYVSDQLLMSKISNMMRSKEITSPCSTKNYIYFPIERKNACCVYVYFL